MPILADLAHPSFDEDRALLDAVPTLGLEARKDAVERLLRSRSQAVREAATRIAATVLGDDDIVRHLRDRDDDVLRNAALEILKHRGRTSVELGITLLKDRDPDIVFQAALLLDHLKDPRALQPLRAVLDHPNENVVQAAIVAIGHIGHAGAAADLIPFLKGPHWVRYAAIQALGDLRVPAGIEALAGLLAEPLTGQLAAESIARIGGEHAFRCLALDWVGTGAADDGRLQLIAHVLEGLSREPPVVKAFRPALVERLTSGAPPGRSAAARCLLALGPGPEDAASLDVLAADPVNGTSLPACLTKRSDLVGPLLAQKGQRRTWGFLLASEHPAEVPMEALAGALLGSPAHEHLDAIARALDRMDGQAIAEVLLDFYCRIPPDARLALAPHMGRHRPFLREALNRVGERGAVGSLLAATLADSPQEAAAAVLDLPPAAQVEVLSQLVDQPETLRLLPWGKWLEEQPAVYGGVATQVAEAAGLRDMLPHIRSLLVKAPHAGLIRVVEALRDRECVPVLAALLERRDPKIQPFLLGALGAIGGSDARKTLREAAVHGDPRWRRLAYRALGECLTEVEEPVFRDASCSDDWHIRLVCAQVLGRVGRPGDIAILARLAADPVSAVAQAARSALDR